MKSCGNCKYRAYTSWDGIDFCYWYEVASTEAEEIENAKGCDRYEEGTPDCLQRDEYCPSATAGDYGPGNPWDAPGCSKSMFIQKGGKQMPRHHRNKDKRKRVRLARLDKVWKAFDNDEYVVAKALTKADCIRICERKGCVVR